MKAWLVLLLLIPTALASESCYDDCVIVHPGPDQPYIYGVDFVDFDVHVDIQGSIAVTRMALTLQNNQEAHQSYTATLPVPPGAPILALNVTTDTEFLEGEVKTASQAQQEYEQAEQEERTALLLSHNGDHVRVQASIPAGEIHLVQLAFVETVPVRADSWYYVLPTSNANANQVSITVQTDSMFTTFPGMDMQIERDNGTIGTYSGTDVADLRVVTRTAASTWQVSTYQGEESFLLSLRFEGGEVYPRDLGMILDKSGSMGGTKIVDARESLVNLLPLLPEEDQFAVWSFETFVHAVTEGFLPVTPENVESAQGQVALIDAGGSTNIYEALQTALRAMPGDGLGTILFLTDGLPSSGITNPDDIIDMVKQEAGETVIHTLAIGLDADRTFLEDISVATGGSLTVLRGDEHLEERLSALYATLHAPVLRNIQLELPEGTAQVFPAPLPTYHDDAVLHVVGKGTLPAEWTLRVRGDTPGGPIDENITVGAAPAVPEVDWLWATEQVDAWLAEERLEDISREEDIVPLAIDYGLITPYTSWIVVSDHSDDDLMEYSDSGADDASFAFDKNGQGSQSGLQNGQQDAQGGEQAGDADEEKETPLPLLVPVLALLWCLRRERS